MFSCFLAAVKPGQFSDGSVPSLEAMCSTAGFEALPFWEVLVRPAFLAKSSQNFLPPSSPRPPPSWRMSTALWPEHVHALQHYSH